MAKPNGYMAFISRSRASDLAQGIRRDDSYYGAEWAKLSAAEKKAYKDRANGRTSGKGLQLTPGHVAAPPAGAIGGAQAEDLTEDERNQEAIEMEEMTQAYIGDEMAGAAARNIIVGSSNVMIRTTEGKFVPLELGLVRYSLQDGVISRYQRFTDPGPVPLGYMNKVMRHMEATHKIPISNFEHAIGHRNKAKELQDMLDEVHTFLGDCKVRYKGKWYFLIFTRDDMLEQLRGSLQWYVEESGHQQMIKLWQEDGFRIVDMSYLLMFLYRVSGAMMALPLCADIPNMVSFDYTPGSCEWHTKEDNLYCALGLCMRWCYLMSDSLLKDYEIEPVIGKHLPESVQSAIHVEEAVSGEVWNTGKDVTRRLPRFMTAASHAGDSRVQNYQSLPASVAGGESEDGNRDPRLSEFGSSSRNSDPRTIGGVGRGQRRQ